MTDATFPSIIGRLLKRCCATPNIDRSPMMTTYATTRYESPAFRAATKGRTPVVDPRCVIVGRCVAWLLAAVTMPAFAEEHAFLSKLQVEEIAAGKKWNMLRRADQQSIRWDLSSAGRLFARNLTIGQSDSGSWLVNETGQLCVKWRGSSTDRCVAVFKEGDALKLSDSTDLTGIFADLTVE